MVLDTSKRSLSTGRPKPARELGESRERIPADLFQALLLDDLLHSVRELTALIQSQIERGFLVQAALNATLLPQDVEFNSPLFSISITNDGPGVLEFNIFPSSTRPSTLLAGEIANISFSTAKILMVRIRGIAGATPAVRIMGTY